MPACSQFRGLPRALLCGCLLLVATAARAVDPSPSSDAAKTAYAAAAALQNREAWELAAEEWQTFIAAHPQQKIMMVGDGLNDAGALKSAYVGVAVTDDTSVFTPSCDAILYGQKLHLLDKFLDLSRSANSIVRWCFIISFLYNVAGLSFAVTGHLTPLVAAILMPLSSITIVVFTTLAVNFVTSRHKL